MKKTDADNGHVLLEGIGSQGVEPVQSSTNANQNQNHGGRFRKINSLEEVREAARVAASRWK